MSDLCIPNGLVQQNSLNLMSDNLKILIIRHLRIVSRMEVLLFTRKVFMNETGRSEIQVQNDLQECLYINHCGYKLRQL
jgi:hypothetical protein